MATTQSAASARTMKTDFPASVITPDSVDTRVGTLKFRDGVPDAATTQKLYDELDYIHAVDAFISGYPLVSQLALRKGFIEAYPRNQVTIEGRSTAWTFPNAKGQPVTYRSCDSGGATYHFCPECGSTVYYEIAAAPDVVGVRVGAFTDPTFPPPNIAGFTPSPCDHRVIPEKELHA